MKMTRHSALLAVLLAGLLDLGCATSRPKEPLDLSQGPLALMITVPEKRVEFYELIGGVFSVRVVDNLYTFEGIWDPSPLIAQQLAHTIQKGFGIAALPLWEHLEEERYHHLIAVCERSFDAARERRKASTRGPALLNEHAHSPPLGYLDSPPPPELRALKDELHADLALEVCIAGMTFTRAEMKVMSGMVPTRYDLLAYGRVVRLSDGRTLRWAKARVGGVKGHIGSFSELEEDDLVPLKEKYKIAVGKLLRPGGKFLRELLE